jgi:hypothetical protein
VGQWRVRIFDRKFGADFLAGVPAAPGIYRLYDATGALVYVAKARNLRRRLAQYRTAIRIKKDRKHRALVRLADRIEWQACGSELEASLTEIRLIQELRPVRNVAGAFPFLYPFVGIQVDGLAVAGNAGVIRVDHQGIRQDHRHHLFAGVTDGESAACITATFARRRSSASSLFCAAERA